MQLRFRGDYKVNFAAKKALTCHQNINLKSCFLWSGVPLHTFFFYFLAVYCDAPWKLLLWAVAPCRSHATLGATVCRQVLSQALTAGCGKHDHNMQSHFDDDKKCAEIFRRAECGAVNTKLLINCGNSQ